MKNLLPHINVILLCLLIVGCTDEDAMVNGQRSMINAPTGQPVLFSVGNENMVKTRAAVPYMAQDGRFVCTMYYHAKATDTDASNFDIKDNSEGGTMTTTWLKVDNNVGNSVYWNKEYNAVADDGLDEYGFDKSATMFYWQNRLTHAFLALADYNKLSTNEAPTETEMATIPSPSTAQGKLKMYPCYDTDLMEQPGEDATEEEIAAYNNTAANGRYANVYDLTRKETRNSAGKITGYGVNTIYQQPDPILALTIMKPSGATQEANRVRLYFKHQFSQIQVNVKGADDNSANITDDQIEGVELLGVSTEGYVCNRLNANGTVGSGTKPLGHKNEKNELDEDIMFGSASAKDVVLDEFTDEVLENNKWGTSFQMFDMRTEGHVEPAYDVYLPWTAATGGVETKYVQEDGDSYIVATNNTYFVYDSVNDKYDLITNIDDYNSASAYKKVEHVTVSYQEFTGTPASGTIYYYKDGSDYKVINDIDNYPDKIYVWIEGDDDYQEFTGTPVSGTTYYYKKVDGENVSYIEIEDIENYGKIYVRIETTTYTYEPITFYMKEHHDAKPTTGYATGYLKSFDAIAFGKLWAIRITWHEGTAQNPGIKHVSTYEVPQKNEEDVNLRDLASATKYIYNLELRRGTLAVIRTEILPWDQKEVLVYGTDGTITN